jgi:succinyl-CoA synthetase alpha subunit
MAILVSDSVNVIVQGITGREAASFTRDMLDYGTRVVAGVTPGKQGIGYFSAGGTGERGRAGGAR